MKTIFKQHKKAVEVGDHFKNGTCPKSQTSRKNFSIKSLLCFFFTIVAGGLVFTSCGKDEKNDAATLAAPTGVTASANSQCVVLSWNSVRGATYYEVYRSRTSVPNSSYTKIGDEEKEYSEDWSPLDGENYYKIVAVKENGSSEIRSAFSESAYVKYSSGNSNNNNNNNDGRTPSAPTSVTASATSSSTISVSWSSVSGATSYEVYYEVGSSPSKKLAGTVSGTSYTHTGLSANTTYYYYIKAINSAGASSYSSSASAKTQSGSGDGGGGSAPSAPTGVTASATSSSSISVSWRSVSGATSYEVYYEVGSSSTKQLAGAVSGTSYTHTGLSAGITYYYYIKSVNNAGSSVYSSNASATTPSSGGSAGGGGGSTNYGPCPVTNPTASGNSYSITVSWGVSTSSGCGTPTSYEVYKQNPNTGQFELLKTTTSKSCSDNTVHPGINRYGIKAINSSGESVNYAFSSEISLSTPTGFTATRSGSNVNFSWSKVNGATEYQIFVSNSASGAYAIATTAQGENTTSKTYYYPASSGTTVYFKIKARWETKHGSPTYVDSNLSSYKSVTF
ncbi:MAG: fibronectin type III domain-containing protein [Prevotellaceae bacterium]|nr:fibronectin type III domain-containing protein [Prevotellaceae bacterium]